MSTEKNNNNINNEYRQSGLGWKPDIPDFRDHIYSSPASLLVKGLPASVDLRLDHIDTDGSCGPDVDKDSNIAGYVFNQGFTNSCRKFCIYGLYFCSIESRHFSYFHHF